MSKIVELTKKAASFFIATNDGDQPKVRPFGAIEEIDGKIYLVTGNTKNFFKQISKNPKIEYVALFDDGSWLRVTGTLAVKDCGKIRAKYLELRPTLQKIYKADDGVFTVLELKDPVAYLYGANGAEKIED